MEEKVKRIIEIASCGALCPYQRIEDGYRRCWREPSFRIICKLSYDSYVDFPSWCPLETSQEFFKRIRLEG